MKILIGITGSVAATISHKIVKAMEEVEGCEEVAVVMTESAKRFMNPTRLMSLTNVKVYCDHDEWLWKEADGSITDRWQKDFPILHIELAKKFDVLVVAPATANTIAKMSNGISDNLLTCVYSAWRKTGNVIVAPSMNMYMWHSPQNMDNIERFKECIVVGPQKKQMACGDYGVGAMADISDIVKEVNNFNE